MTALHLCSLLWIFFFFFWSGEHFSFEIRPSSHSWSQRWPLGWPLRQDNAFPSKFSQQELNVLSLVTIQARSASATLLVPPTPGPESPTLASSIGPNTCPAHAYLCAFILVVAALCLDAISPIASWFTQTFPKLQCTSTPGPGRQSTEDRNGLWGQRRLVSSPPRSSLAVWP